MCTDKAIQAYLFVKNTIRSLNILNDCIDNIYSHARYTSDIVQNDEEYDKSVIMTLHLDDILKANSEQPKHNQIKKKPDPYTCKHCSKIFASEVGLRIHETSHYKKKTKVVLDKKDKLSVTKCDTCNVPLLSAELKEHMKTHKRDTWQCTSCSNIYYSEATFTNHLKNKHNLTKESLLKCDFCLKLFLCNEMLQIHKCQYRCPECTEIPCPHHMYLVSYRNQRVGGSEIGQCVDCDFQSNRRHGIIAHVNIEHLNIFTFACDDCGITFQTKHALTNHRVKIHQEMFSCRHCNDHFGSSRLLDNHQNDCKAKEMSFQCEMCDEKFVNKEAMTFHIIRHYDDGFSCPICFSKFTTENELDIHRKKDHKVTIPCTMCIQDFDSTEEYKKHLETHKPGAKHICRVCNMSFNSLLNHRKHVKWHFLSLKKKECPHCRNYVTASYYKAHVKSHLKIGKEFKDSKPIVKDHHCEMCGKLFSTANVLKRHKVIHKDHEQCHICKKYMKPSLLANHIEDHNEDSTKPKGGNKNIIKCSQCDYCTYYALCMQAHQNRVHLKMRPFKCTVCSKSFYARNNLTEHIKAHDKNNSCRKTCAVCGNRFLNSQCLKKHMRIHTGEKPYKCNSCDDVFLSASRRQEHQLRQHSLPNFICPICPNVYYTLREMRAHMKKFHYMGRKDDGEFDLDAVPDDYKYIFKDGRLGG